MVQKKNYYKWHSKYYYGILDEVKPFLATKSVLDLGCGIGWFGEVLKEFNPSIRVTNIDNDLTGYTNPDNPPILLEGNKLPFLDDTFDGVVAKAVIEHLWEPLIFFKEFYRVIKLGGIVFISVPDSRCKTFWNDYTHIRPFTKKSLTSLLEDGGFSIQRIYYMSSFPDLGLFAFLPNYFKKYSSVPKIAQIMGTIGVGSSTINCMAIKKC